MEILKSAPTKYSKNCTKHCQNERSTLDDKNGAVVDCSIPWAVRLSE